MVWHEDHLFSLLTSQRDKITKNPLRYQLPQWILTIIVYLSLNPVFNHEDMVKYL